MPPSEINNADFKILERVFAAEIESRLPAQIGKSRRVVTLEERGLIEPITRTLGGRFPVTVKGHALTQRGRIIYCQACTAVED